MILNNIEIFINSGWFTVPYNKIYYDENGRKVMEPAVAWSKYIIEKNTYASPAGALICKNVVVIDCDTEESANHLIEVAKFKNIKNLMDLKTEDEIEKQKLAADVGLIVATTRGYHFYFSDEDSLEPVKGPQMDIQASDRKLVFLPTQASEGKKIVAAKTVLDSEGKLKIKLSPLPDTLKVFIKNLAKGPEETAARRKVRFTGGTPLATIPQGTDLYFRRMTPKSYRADPYYRQIIDKKGFLHPDDIKYGQGNTYMTEIAGILCSDVTINVDKFWSNIRFINSCWSDPLDDKALVEKVRRYAEGKYPGCPFNYDEDWDKAGYSFTDIDGMEMTVCYDLMSSRYLVVDLSKGKIYNKNSHEIVSFYANRRGVKVTASQLATWLPGVEVIYDPMLPFGLLEDNKFNGFKRSKYVEMLFDNSCYSEAEIAWAKSAKTLRFFKHLFGDSCDYWLSFLRKKLTTFSYSPTSFYLFDERGGAGKGVLEAWLGYFVGKDKVANVPYETFRSKFTSDIEGKLFVFLNEFPDNPIERRTITDKIKGLTGSSIAKIEKKGLDPYEAINLATYMLTSNKVSIEIKDGDRRFCVVQCLKKFDDVFGEHFFETITGDEELRKVAIYLKHCVSDLPHKQYVNPPMNDAKSMFLDSVSTDLDRAVSALLANDWSALEEIQEGCVEAEKHAVNLSLLAKRLGVTVSSLMSKLKPYIIEGRLDGYRKDDRIRKVAMLVFQENAMDDFQKPETIIKHSNFLKI